MRRILLYGFGSFSYRGAWFDWNPSGEVASSLDGWEAGGFRVVGVELEASRRGLEELRRLIRSVEPWAILGLGLYSKPSPHLRVEVVAVNALCDGDCEPISLDEPMWGAVSCTADPRRVAEAAGRWVGASPSASIGLYYCNASAYIAYRWGRERRVPSIFIHVPPTTRLCERMGVRWEVCTPDWALRRAVVEVLGELASEAARGGR